LNALTSGPPVGQAFDQLMGVPLGPLQQPTSAFRLVRGDRYAAL
jgi:hypothetical protein